MRCLKLTDDEMKIVKGLSFEMTRQYLKASKYMVYLSFVDNDADTMSLLNDIGKIVNLPLVPSDNIVNELKEIPGIDEIIFAAIWDRSKIKPEILHDYGVIQFYLDIVKEIKDI